MDGEATTIIQVLHTKGSKHCILILVYENMGCTSGIFMRASKHNAPNILKSHSSGCRLVHSIHVFYLLMVTIQLTKECAVPAKTDILQSFQQFIIRSSVSINILNGTYCTLSNKVFQGIYLTLLYHIKEMTRFDIILIPKIAKNEFSSPQLFNKGIFLRNRCTAAFHFRVCPLPFIDIQLSASYP